MRILVVDDHGLTIELMRLTLSSVGHSVISATSVEEALRLTASDRPELILSDLTFPSSTGRGKNGHDLARAVRSTKSRDEIGLLAITGASSPKELQAALDSGFDDVVVKPFTVESLLERIGSLHRP